MRVRPRARRSARADGATRAHNTLSAETTHVRVFYPFHPLHGLSLRVVRKPKLGDGAASVIDPTGRRLKIPVWMLSPAASEMKIAARPQLGRDALLRLTSLLATPLHAEGSDHDTLHQTGVDRCKGGDRAATTTDGSHDPTGAGPRADRRHGARRTRRPHGSHAGGGLSRNRKERR
jgi:hypothetical protein